MEISEQELSTKIAEAVAAETAGLIQKRDQLLGQEAQMKAKLQQIEDDKVAAIKKAEDDQLAAEGKWKELAEKQQNEHSAEIKNLKDSLSALQETNTKLDGSLRSRIVDQELNNQLLTAGVTDPVLMKAATALISGEVEVVEVDGELVAQLHGKSIEDHIKVWSEADGKSFIASGKSGGGGPGSGGGGGTNTDWDKFFDKNSPEYNATKQQELRKEDPDQYTALAKKFAPNQQPLTAGRV